MEQDKIARQMVDYTFDAKDTANPIKPINYTVSNMNEYTASDLWPVFNNLETYNGQSTTECRKPAFDYIVAEYQKGKELIDILHNMALSYVRNLDASHKALLCEVVQQGRTYNGIRSSEPLEKGIYIMMIKHFAGYIKKSSKSWYSYNRTDYNQYAEALYIEHYGMIKQIENMDF